jgi:hypothetical protein
MILMLAALATTAIAEPGFWHPNDVMPQSEAFKKINESALGPFEEKNRQAEQIGIALSRYQVALDLLGPAASDEERSRLDALEKTYRRERAVLEAFADTFITDVDDTFQGAVQRAVDTLEMEIEVCEAEVATGPQVPGIRLRTQPNPDCVGANMNRKIAQMLDIDEALAADVAEIIALDWPSFTKDTATVAPAGSGERWVSVSVLFRKGAKKTLRAIEQQEEQRRLKVHAAIEQGAEGEALEALSKQSDAIEAQSAASRAALAEPVFTAAEKAMAKSGGLGWCATPPMFGGCIGQDMTNELIGRLLDDKKVQKAFTKGRDAAAANRD